MTSPITKSIEYRPLKGSISSLFILFFFFAASNWTTHDTKNATAGKSLTRYLVERITDIRQLRCVGNSETKR